MEAIDFSKPLLCEHCGMNLTGRGLIANMDHMQTHNAIEVYRVPTDNEMREMFLELGMPTIGFTGMGLAEPSETERKIFEDNSRFIKFK